MEAGIRLLHIDNTHVFVALIHYPVYDKNGEIVATSITNHDIHDISRVAKTYNLGGYYMVTPVISQQELCQRIIRHWVDGFGSQYNHTRQEAFASTWLADSLVDVIKSVEEKFRRTPTVMITSAREHLARECGKPLITFREGRQWLREETEKPCLMVLGTGYGVENDYIRTYSDVILEPIRGVGSYNHLSVRSAAAIMFDRLFGRDDL
ncbi:hypothetical protein CSB45_10370 [candidate division KSB3 bacterium]|uniref:tRNA (guanine-N(1)-)-methyltransferase C-terminal domain-containing protein n=1 Tax=candidate division KSB3 bacterium TaxID=2044937 RepID=A0A2G6E3J9_9BACT|nr:MAG: hypothetical protein CSB45_10370 [candidate division KSB3 bacterium]PIE29181.1 MAG: hypothetical protein CSA57_10255 [candidate division KSB3 bacterium]